MAVERGLDPCSSFMNPAMTGRMTIVRLWLIACTYLLLAQCGPVDVLNAVTPDKSIASVETIAFASGPRQSLDLYTPKTPKDGAPIIVFIYGGSWDTGAKEDYKFAAEAFTSAGYSVAVPDYRLYPDVVYPAFIEDVAMAASWTAQRFPGRPLALIGHSAGAHSALMLALETPFLQNQGVERCQTIAAAVGLSGPYGALPLKREPFITIFPERMTGQDAPLNNVSAKTPPIFLATGLKDTKVLPANTISLADELEEAGADVTLTPYRDLDHVDTVKLLADFFADESSLRSDVLGFLEQHSSTKAPFC